MKRTDQIFRLIPALVAVLTLLLFLPGCGYKAGLDAGGGLFSWHSDVLGEDGRSGLFAVMSEYGLSELYQYIPSSADPDVVSDFCRSARETGISVYYLAGEREWGTDPTGMALMRAVSAADRYGCFDGIIFDVESWLLSEWKDDQASASGDYLTAFKICRVFAHMHGLGVTICLPYYTESIMSRRTLSELIGSGCDRLAVMNYYRKNEAAHIVTEAELCRDHGRPLINIYELQPAGKNGLTEINTYHGSSLPDVYESFDALRESYPGLTIGLALHEYRAFKEMTDNE